MGTTTETVGEGYAAVRGVAALAVMLAAARMPGRLAGAGATLAARVAPPEAPEDPAVRVPAQRVRPASARAAAGHSITV